ncbi:PREDICTED: kinetochore protein SLK19 isoform X2 [Nicrophorus vespilloides]|uniref:Kinetochore protein SLK19 isoform X2 n=1 Tax=Nicrophorus vespilloides TaxID=110193 RepID=A0ABM1NDZ4_NICVS|nr:PREDICTED: kinetochore protein SLK19 isoform X2 [Nicrophorus vespilloides]
MFLNLHHSRLCGRRSAQKRKKMTPWLGPLCVFSLLVIGSSAAPPNQKVTNEDIRDAILSVVHMLRAVEDKLERHEFRDRMSDDTLRKSILLLDKRVKQLDPVKGVVSRLDERLANVETILMQRDEREKAQLQKTFAAVEDIQKNLPTVMEKLKSDIIEKLPVVPDFTLPDITVLPDKNDLKAAQKAIVDKVEGVVEAHQKLGKEFEKIKKDSEGFMNESRKSAENFDRVKKQLGSSEMLLQKYEHTLSELNDKIPTDIVQLEDQKDWQANFMQAFNNQSDNVKLILSDVKMLVGQVELLPQKGDLEDVKNSTQSGLDELKYQASSVADKSESTLDAKLKELKTGIDKDNEIVIKNINDLSEMTGSLMGTISASYDQLKNEIAALSKVEQVMVQTADGVLDTKRRVDYGVQQILLEVTNLIKESGDKINATIIDRFDTFEQTVLDEENGALANLTYKIGQDIDQVWRQIGIMHQQMSSSSDTLNKLQNQTDIYVTGSLDAMDSMKSKVGQITNRMNEVDDNLNHLMGRLSLVSQEFNRIKDGLSGAMDQIRKSFAAVQDEIKDIGPGPHQIADSVEAN